VKSTEREKNFLPPKGIEARFVCLLARGLVIIQKGPSYWWLLSYYCGSKTIDCRWPRGLRRGCVAARLLGLRVWIPPETWMSVSCECCVLSDRCICFGMITRPEESYRVWCFRVWQRKLIMRRARPTGKSHARGKKKIVDYFPWEPYESYSIIIHCGKTHFPNVTIRDTFS
jgi:hypothetical protein